MPHIFINKYSNTSSKPSAYSPELESIVFPELYPIEPFEPKRLSEILKETLSLKEEALKEEGVQYDSKDILLKAIAIKNKFEELNLSEESYKKFVEKEFKEQDEVQDEETIIEYSSEEPILTYEVIPYKLQGTTIYMDTTCDIKLEIQAEPSFDWDPVLVAKTKVKCIQFLLIILTRLFINTLYSQINKYKGAEIIVVSASYVTPHLKEMDEELENEIVELAEIDEDLAFYQKNAFYCNLDFNGFQPVLEALFSLDKLIEDLTSKISLIFSGNTFSRGVYSKSLLNGGLSSYDLFMNRAIKNLNVTHKVRSQKRRAQIDVVSEFDTFMSNLKHEYKPKLTVEQEQIEKYLNDPILTGSLYRGFMFQKSHKISSIQDRMQKKNILRLIKAGRIMDIVGFVMQKYITRREILWKYLNRIFARLRFYAIGQDYRVYKNKFARTYVSQTAKYMVRNGKRQLNAKFIKCVELRITRKFYNEYCNFFNKIHLLNKELYYFYDKFFQFVHHKNNIIFDKNYAIAYKGIVYPFDTVMRKYQESNKKGRLKIFNHIFLTKKHHVEKYVCRSLQKKRQMPLEQFIQILIREKYYPANRRTKILPKINRWLMKYVSDEQDKGFLYSYARPRIILDKLEEKVEASYPYIPRSPLRFVRDNIDDKFKKTKYLKYRIIQLTRPKIVLQSGFFHKARRVTKNLLQTKLNSTCNVPVRVNRLLRFCNIFYKNLLVNNKYEKFMKHLQKFKTLYLLNPEFKTKTSSYIGYLLFLMVSPLFNGITQEREYAHQLKTFLNNYLVRLRLFFRYDLANSFHNVHKGYLRPLSRNWFFYQKLVASARKIMQKKPNWRFMTYMFRRSAKRLTVRVRSKAIAVRGMYPLFKYNLMATDWCSPMNLKKRSLTKASILLLQNRVNKKVKTKFKTYIAALKKSYGYSAAYHTDARLYYFAPYNLFMKKFEGDLLPEEDIITKYKEIKHDYIGENFDDEDTNIYSEDIGFDYEEYETRDPEDQYDEEESKELNN